MQNEDQRPYTYLDYAATAPLGPEAADAMAPYLVPGPENLLVGGNPNSLHSCGRDAFKAMEQARRTFATAIGARRPQEVIFTSGATEADNDALLGIAEGARQHLIRHGAAPEKPRVIVSAIEHDAVLAPAKRLEALGFAVTRLRPNAQGFITEEALAQALGPDVILVSVQLANSEVGSIQPIAALAKLTHEAGALFHTDAVQALGKIELSVSELDVDAASFSAHKVGGPTGIGALYLRLRTPFEPQMLGGGQEEGQRSGTQNVCGMAGFAATATQAADHATEERVRLTALRDQLYEQLQALPGVRATVNVAPKDERYLPNIVHVLVDNLESQTLILRLDSLGYGVSGGSACSSHSLEPSHVLRSMGVSSDDAQGALRVSMGRFTTEEDIAGFMDAMKQALAWEAR